MVWTLPTITNTQLSNIKIFNNGVPVDVILEPQIEQVKQNEQDVFKLSNKEFLENMSTELRQLFELLTYKNQSEFISIDTFIKNNRLLYIGVFIVITSLILWLISALFFKSS